MVYLTRMNPQISPGTENSERAVRSGLCSVTEGGFCPPPLSSTRLGHSPPYVLNAQKAPSFPMPSIAFSLKPEARDAGMPIRALLHGNPKIATNAPSSGV